MLKMLQDTKSQTLSGFLAGDFCRVSPETGGEMCKAAKVSPERKAAGAEGAGGGNPVSDDSRDEDHGAADQLHFADRREGDALRAL